MCVYFSVLIRQWSSLRPARPLLRDKGTSNASVYRVGAPQEEEAMDMLSGRGYRSSSSSSSSYLSITHAKNSLRDIASSKLSRFQRHFLASKITFHKWYFEMGNFPSAGPLNVSSCTMACWCRRMCLHLRGRTALSSQTQLADVPEDWQQPIMMSWVQQPSPA